MDSADYLEVTIRIEPFDEQMAEILEAQISEIGFDAFMIESPSTKCYIQTDLFNEDALKEILSSTSEMTGCTFSYTFEKMPDVNWNATWEQEGFTPIIVDNEVAIIPEGSAAENPTRFEIELAANMAFGTGHHHTTFMMMQTMLDIEDSIRGAHVTDLGCGTAVLAILASMMGASHVDAIDIDAVAARSAEDNVKRNACLGNTTVKCGDASLLCPNGTDILLANIHRNIIIGDIRTYADCVREGGYLLVSGFYDTDCKDIISAAKDAGFQPADVDEGNWSRYRENWACLKFRRQA